jgi:hypothetical protein
MLSSKCQGLAALVLLALAACGPQAEQRDADVRRNVVIADDICAQIIDAAPPAQEEGWSIVTRDELSESDRTNWNTYHRVECPGLAEDNAWIGYSQPVYAVTLIQESGDALLQKVVVLRPGASGYTAQTVWGPSEVPTPNVVYISSVPNQRATPPQQTPAFMFERMESQVTAFYEEEGQLRSHSWGP